MLGGANPKGISLHIGLNRVDPVHYAGWKGELVACENDARDMETIARSQGLVAQSLLTKAATSTALLGLIEKAARELVPDDFFSLPYSCHGRQINDVHNHDPSALDDTCALSARDLVRHALSPLTHPFRPRFLFVVFSH